MTSKIIPLHQESKLSLKLPLQFLLYSVSMVKIGYLSFLATVETVKLSGSGHLGTVSQLANYIRFISETLLGSRFYSSVLM